MLNWFKRKKMTKKSNIELLDLMEFPNSKKQPLKIVNSKSTIKKALNASTVVQTEVLAKVDLEEEKSSKVFSLLNNVSWNITMLYYLIFFIIFLLYLTYVYKHNADLRVAYNLITILLTRDFLAMLPPDFVLEIDAEMAKQLILERERSTWSGLNKEFVREFKGLLDSLVQVGTQLQNVAYENVVKIKDLIIKTSENVVAFSKKEQGVVLSLPDMLVSQESPVAGISRLESSKIVNVYALKRK
jgi:hypothetical protein